MKRVIFGVFAHPDDEAFGPAATLLKESREGTEVHIITLTAGEAGANPDNDENLAETRLAEWRNSGDLMGVRPEAMHFLGYQDGKLANTDMIEIAEKVETLVQNRLNNLAPDDTVELLCFDLNGLTGHIDHIVASRAACLAFYHLKATDERVRRIRLYCQPDSLAPEANTDWIYAERGRREDEISETIDASQYTDDLVAIVRAHHSQRADGESYLEKMASHNVLGINYFIVLD